MVTKNTYEIIIKEKVNCETCDNSVYKTQQCSKCLELELSFNSLKHKDKEKAKLWLKKQLKLLN